jgi:hypothetical protein
MRSTFATPNASPAHSGIIALVGGDAMASGADAVAAGEVTNKVKDLGVVTIASGEAVFAAEGTNPSANTGVRMAGEDVLFEVTVNEHGGSGSTAWAESVTKYVAIDIPGWNPPGGPIVVDRVINLPSVPGTAVRDELQAAHQIGAELGLPGANVARDTLTADAYTVTGEGSLVIGFSDALAIGGQLSAVYAWALVAA